MYLFELKDVVYFKDTLDTSTVSGCERAGGCAVNLNLEENCPEQLQFMDERPKVRTTRFPQELFATSRALAAGIRVITLTTMKCAVEDNSLLLHDVERREQLCSTTPNLSGYNHCLKKARNCSGSLRGCHIFAFRQETAHLHGRQPLSCSVLLINGTQQAGKKKTALHLHAHQSSSSCVFGVRSTFVEDARCPF